MPGNNNVIELVFKLRDSVTAPLNALRGKIGTALKFAGALTGLISIGAAFSKVIHASREAEDELANFSIAYKNLGQTVGKTKQEMISFADEAGKRTIFDDESVLKAQATLLKFKSVQGDTFTRARQITLDLASAMRTDLTSAANIVGRAVERPSIALRQLRQAGVIFSADQEKVIKQLEATGHKAEASGILLDALATKTKGAAAAAAGTLSGALKILETAWNNLFEADTGPLTEAVSGLAKTFNNPEFKAGIQDLLAVMVKVAAKAAEAAGWVLRIGTGGSGADGLSNALVRGFNGGGLGSPFRDFSALGDAKTDLVKQQKELNSLLQKQKTYQTDTWYLREVLAPQIKLEEALIATSKQRISILAGIDAASKKSGKNRSGGDRGVPGLNAADSLVSTDITEVTVKALKSTQDAVDALYESWKDSSLSQVDREIKQYYQRLAQLDELKAAGKISAEQYARAFNEALEEALPEVKVTVKKTMDYIPTEAEQRFKDFSESLASSLGNAIEQGGLHGLTSLRDILKQTLRGMLADILTSGIKKAMADLGTVIFGKKDSGGGGGGFISSIIKGIGSLFGKAGGGRAKGWTPVGEDGPELAYFGSGGSVYNARSMAGWGSGGGAKINIGGTQIIVQGDTDQKSLRMTKEYVDVSNARLYREVLQMLGRNGLKRPK